MTPLELIEAHAPMVRSLIRLHLGRGPDAEDAWQDIYLLVHRGWPGYRGTAAPPPGGRTGPSGIETCRPGFVSLVSFVSM